jgi:YHS domain-containing protein
VVYKIIRKFQRGGGTEDVKPLPKNDWPIKGEDLVQDPFCKTYIPKSQAYIHDIEGKETFFCSKDCCEKYLTGQK